METKIQEILQEPVMPKVLKVAAYARVSTSEEDQQHSYQSQVTEYTERIKANPNWSFAGLYGDEGISGTSLKRRVQFNKMIQEARNGNIDLIITKSISRFGRNTIDVLKIVQEMRERKVEIYFEKEQIYASDTKVDVLLTMLSSFSQEESRSISENVKWGIRKRMKRGEYASNISNILGYSRSKDGTVEIDEENANTVRIIFNLFLAGYSYRDIIDYLKERNIKTASGKEKWSVSTISMMLSNEKYCGDLLFQKTMIVNFLSHKSVKNNGELPKYLIKDHHEPIISRDKFNLVQLMMKNIKGDKRMGNRHYPLSGLLVCADCRRSMLMVTCHPGKQYSWKVFSCKAKRNTSESTTCTCHNKPIKAVEFEKEITNILVKYINLQGYSVSGLLETINQAKADSEDTVLKIESLKAKILHLQEEVKRIVRLKISTNDSFNSSLYEEQFNKTKMELTEKQKQLEDCETKCLENMQRSIDSTAIESFLNSDDKILSDKVIDSYVRKIVRISEQEFVVVLGKGFLTNEQAIDNLPRIQSKKPLFITKCENNGLNLIIKAIELEG